MIWSRWLGLVFGNTTLSVSIVLGSFMMGLALGSWVIGKALHSIRNPMRMYAFMELGIGIFAVVRREDMAPNRPNMANGGKGRGRVKSVPPLANILNLLA